MRGVTHAAVGANAVWIPVALGWVVAPWWVAVAAFVALIPDLDASESTIKNLSIGSRHMRVKPLAPVALVTGMVFGHRGFLHSAVILVAVSIVIAVLLPTNTVAWMVVLLAYLSHLLLDALTKSGIGLLWPLQLRIGLLPRMLRVRTGGLLDTVLLLLGAAGVVIFLYSFASIPFEL
ncbi:MAG: metal-dependent hydrolase [Patescibacteria group bacterium]